jgi:hypothetical protein
MRLSQEDDGHVHHLWYELYLQKYYSYSSARLVRAGALSASRQPLPSIKQRLLLEFVRNCAEQWPRTGSHLIWDLSENRVHEAGVQHTAPTCAGFGSTVVEMSVRISHLLSPRSRDLPAPGCDPTF